MNSRFSDYLQKTFDFSSTEAEEIILAMKKPLGKSIRINTRKISREDFKLHASEQGWTLTDTEIPEVFLIDRTDTSIALGNTLEHQAGWFYIQEVAAAMPPHLLRNEMLKIKNIKLREDYDNLDSTSRPAPLSKEDEGDIKKVELDLAGMTGTILDMCAAPGGKTTQLADYFPESLIIANEVNRTRTPQLFENLDRMGYDNIAVVSCDGRFFQNFPDFFDAVLLDAPCSGEGTAFRDASVLEHWHEKNIHRIAKLQKQLMETAQTITKPGGFLSYSTCTLNKEENENITNTQHSTFNTLFQKRFWPHIEHTGGFFASIFGKKTPFVKGELKGDLSRNNPPALQATSFLKEAPYKYPILAAQGQKHLIVKPATKGEYEIVERFIAKYLKTKLTSGFLYLIKDGVYFHKKNLGPLAEHFYFVHGGMRIGQIKGNAFTPTHHMAWCLESQEYIPLLRLSMEDGKKLDLSIPDGTKDGYYMLQYGRGVLGIVEIKNGSIDRHFLK